MNNSLPAPPISGLAPIADQYDAFILDLWGTIHNGFEPLPGAVDCLRALKEQGKDLLVLSNAPRRIGAVVDRMDIVGIPRDLYGDVMSSGEAAWRALNAREDAWHGALGSECFLIGEAGDESVLSDQPDVSAVENLADADFIVAVGAFKRSDTLEVYETLLRDARAGQLPMLCANPDLEVLRGPNREICAGAIAACYEEMGGDVFYHGKPHPPIYDLCFDLLSGHDRSRILAVGDSLRTDIAGASSVGIASYFVTGGILAESLGIEPLADPSVEALSKIYEEYGVTPTHTGAAFRW
jgi:HAD superfamily hydrolase (TIGR01459 family)